MTAERFSDPDGAYTIDQYPPGTAIIHFVRHGEKRQWVVGATGNETKAEIKRHLNLWISEARFVSVDVKTLAGIVIKR